MNDGFGLRETLFGIFENLIQFVVALIPRLVVGVVVLLVGVLVAKIIARILKTTFARARVDSLLEKLGISQMARGIGIRGSLSEAASQLVYYLLIILFVRGAANSIGLSIVGEAIESFFAYLPNLIAALLVLVLGNVVAQFAGRAVQESAADSGVDYAPALGRAVSAGVLFVVTIMAITQLGIDTAMIRTVVIIGLSGAALALALSFGVGSRDITKNLVAGFYVRKLFAIGDSVQVGSARGTVSAVTPTQTILEDDEGTISVANAILLQENLRQQDRKS